MTNNEQEQAPTPGQDEGAESESGFSEAFAERAKGEEKPPAAEQSAATDPADEAGSEQPPAPAGDSDTGSESKAQALDPFAGMTPEQRSHWERVVSSERSQRGRVGALTKKLNAATSRPAEAAPTAEATSTPTAAEAAASDLEARLTSVAEEYGDVNGPVVEAIKDLRAEIASLKASPQRETVTDDDTEAMAAAYDQLGAKHPDYVEVGSSPEFAQWVGQQPESVVKLINSYDPQEVSLGITLYKAEAGLSGAAGGQSGGNGSTAQDDKRARQLEGNRQAATRGMPAATGVPDEFGTAFKARAKQFAKP